MKFIIALSAVIVFSLSFYSCSKSSNKNLTNDNSVMKATIAGTPFSVSGPSSAFATSSSSGGLNFLYLNGLSADGKAIQITLIDVTTIGTVQFATGNAAADYYSSGGFQGPYSYATSGSITINSFTPDVTGSFNFIGIGT